MERPVPRQARLVLIGLGGNTGEPPRTLATAVEALRGILGEVRTSALYRTAPVGFADQPDFANLVVRGWTTLVPLELLRALQEVEQRLGRRRSFRNAPRAVDLDLLAYGDLVVDSAELVLPHPRLHERAFVLVPLRDVAPEWRHPISGRNAAEMLETAPPARVEPWPADPS
jgi:2-amino-4-hydroxy-6-hydroxymethyldihydropteridine diphosphokinase